MFRTLLSGAVIVTGVVLSGNAAQADTQKGRCSVAASVHGGKKFVVLKCDRERHPGDYIIRSMIWEKNDRAAYNRVARFSGRRFTCDITFTDTSRSGDMEYTHYKLGKCR